MQRMLSRDYVQCRFRAAGVRRHRYKKFGFGLSGCRPWIRSPLKVACKRSTWNSAVCDRVRKRTARLAYIAQRAGPINPFTQEFELLITRNTSLWNITRND